MDKHLNELCDLLDDEAVRQETMQSLLATQREAVIHRDLALLEAKTAAIQCLIQESADAEGQRHGVLRTIVAGFDLPIERQTLSELILVAPDRYARRLQEVQDRLRGVLAQSKPVAFNNARTLKWSLKSVENCLDVITGKNDPRTDRYDDSGRGARKGQRSPALIDAQG
jgi:hypothetical protein